MDFYPLVVLVVSIAFLFFLILRLRFNAFLALVMAATAVGVLSPEVSFQDVMPQVAQNFGRVCTGIGIVIALAALVGQCLMESGAADKITRVFVRILGDKNASLSLVASGYVLAIPVFFDTVFYLLVPLARAMRIRTGHSYLLFVMSICAGAAVTHSLVPPTPGPLAMADTLNIDLGVMILVGAAIGLPASVVGWLYSLYLNRKLDLPLREAPGLSLQELEALAQRPEEELPGFWLSMAPILLPVLLITTNTFAQAFLPGSRIADMSAFFGNPNFALLVSALIAIWVLARQRGYGLGQIAQVAETAFMSGGLIILITAAGGAFGGMLVSAKVGERLGALAQQVGMPYLILGFLIAVLMKVAQGSGTVSMITTSAIMAPLVAGSNLGFHPVYLACAIGSGSLVGSWMNDSGFWVYKQMSGFTELESLKTWTTLLIVLGVTGFIVTVIASQLVPLK